MRQAIGADPQSPEAGVHGNATERGLGDGHHLHSDLARLVVLGRGDGPLLPQGRRLVRRSDDPARTRARCRVNGGSPAAAAQGDDSLEPRPWLRRTSRTTSTRSTIRQGVTATWAVSALINSKPPTKRGDSVSTKSWELQYGTPTEYRATRRALGLSAEKWNTTGHFRAKPVCDATMYGFNPVTASFLCRSKGDLPSNSRGSSSS